MSVWFVYMIRTAHNQLYTGISTDPSRRLQEHQQGAPKGAKFLRGKGPLRLVYQQLVGSRAQASQMEYQLKKLSKVKKEQLVQHQAPLSLMLLTK